MKNIRKSLRKELFENYDIEYDKETKIVTIRKPVKVKDFIMLKHFFKEMNISDIRVW